MRGGYGLRQAFLKIVKDMPELLDTLVHHPSTMIVVGVSAFLLFMGETLGTAQKLPSPWQRALERSDSASPRPDTSRGVDFGMKCIEASVGAAPEGDYWYYRPFDYPQKSTSAESSNLANTRVM
jgi:hypothetical protein